MVGAPGRIRTADPLVRSQVLYPTELRARNKKLYFNTGGERGIIPYIPVLHPCRAVVVTLQRSILFLTKLSNPQLGFQNPEHRNQFKKGLFTKKALF